MYRTLGFLLGFACLAAIAGCAASASKGVEEGRLERLGTDEIREVLTGRSENWPGQGSVYYKEDGTIENIWKGEETTGTWWAENDLRCYDVAEWGGESCHQLYREGDKILFVRDGTDTIAPQELVDGKQF